MRTGRLFTQSALVFALSALGCSASEPPAAADDPTLRDARDRIPAGAPSIRGTITAVSPERGSMLGRVRIEERPDQASGDNKAVVDVTQRTRIFRREGTGFRPAAFADLRVGSPAEAWFTGPVRESYPVQAAASAIVIR